MSNQPTMAILQLTDNQAAAFRKAAATFRLDPKELIVAAAMTFLNGLQDDPESLGCFLIDIHRFIDQGEPATLPPIMG